MCWKRSRAARASFGAQRCTFGPTPRTELAFPDPAKTLSKGFPAIRIRKWGGKGSGCGEGARRERRQDDPSHSMLHVQQGAPLPCPCDVAASRRPVPCGSGRRAHAPWGIHSRCRAVHFDPETRNLRGTSGLWLFLCMLLPRVRVSHAEVIASWSCSTGCPPERCRGTSLIRNRHPVGPYSRTMPRLVRRS